MSLVTRAMREKCVVWPMQGLDGYGSAIVGEPVEVACRWTEKSTQVAGKDGELVMAHAEIMIAIDVAVGSFVRFGALTDVPTGSDMSKPANIPGAERVVSFSRTKNLKGTVVVRMVYL